MKETNNKNRKEDIKLSKGTYSIPPRTEVRGDGENAFAEARIAAKTTDW